MMLIQFNVLYTTYYKKVYSTCLFILKDPILAEDATQEAFTKAYAKIDTLKNSQVFGQWINSIAARTAIDMYREKKKVFVMEDSALIDFLVSKTVEHKDQLDEKIMQIEIRTELRWVINKLNSRFKKVILLKYYWQLKDKEIANLLGIPVGTVKSNLYRAKKQLKYILKAQNKQQTNISIYW